MRCITAIFLVVTAAAMCSEKLSLAIEQPGDFFVIDEQGEIQLVGHFDMDLTVFFRAYADGKKERGRAPFTVGRYHAGKVEGISSGRMEYSISGDQIVFSFSPGVEDAGLNFLILFDPSKEVLFGEASEGNVSGPKLVGTAHVRFRKQVPNQSPQPILASGPLG